MIANTFFSQNLKEGNIGEAIAAEFLTSVGFSVDDVSSNPDYFYKDIDLIATIDEETITVEVKADAKVSSTGNVCIEVIGNKAKNKKGWIIKPLPQESKLLQTYYTIAIRRWRLL